MRTIRFDTGGYPLELVTKVRSLEKNLRQLDQIAIDFRYCAHLYLFCYQQREKTRDMRDKYGFSDLHMFNNVTQWFIIAGRNGAILLHSFKELMQEINSSAIPNEIISIDVNKRRIGSKLFREHFSDIDLIRNSTAHPYSYMKNEKSWAKHSVDNFLYVQNSIGPGENQLSYGSTVNGRFVSYILSEDSAGILDSVVDHYFRAYSPPSYDHSLPPSDPFGYGEDVFNSDKSRRSTWWHRLLPDKK